MDRLGTEMVSEGERGGSGQDGPGTRGAEMELGAPRGWSWGQVLGAGVLHEKDTL